MWEEGRLTWGGGEARGCLKGESSTPGRDFRDVQCKPNTPQVGPWRNDCFSQLLGSCLGKQMFVFVALGKVHVVGVAVGICLGMVAWQRFKAPPRREGTTEPGLLPLWH